MTLAPARSAPNSWAVPGMPRARALAAACLMLVLAACSSVDRPKPTPLENYSSKIAGRQVWSVKLDKLRFPLVATARNGSFFVAGSDGAVLAIDAQSGREQWRTSVGAPLTAGVGSDGRYTSVVTRDNEVVTLDGGKEIWRKRVPARVSTPPLVAGERVFVMGVDRVVIAFDALDGRRLWTLQRPGDALTLAQAGVVTSYKDLLLVGQGARLTAVDPLKGSVRWEVSIGSPRGTNEVERLADLVGPALRTGETVCSRSFQLAVGCVDAERGGLVWARNSGGTNAIGGDAELLFGADASDRITAWRTPSGEVAWTSEKLLYRGLSAPMSAGRTVVFGDSEGQLHFLSREDGQTLLRLPTDGSAVVGTPVLSGTTMLVVTRDGGLFAFRPE